MDEIFNGNLTQQEPISEVAVEAAIKILRSGRLHRYNTAEGEIDETSLLEVEFAELVGAKFALAVTSGGYAMGCALRAIGVKKDDLVLSNAFTLAPVPGAIDGVGAKPVFVDIDEETLLIDPDKIEEAITPRTKAIIPVHLYGRVCDMEKINKISKKHNLVVIEDTAQAFGASCHCGKPAGMMSDVGTFSFYKTKNLSTFEGGMICIPCLLYTSPSPRD